MGLGPSSVRLILESHATSLDNEAGLASGWFDVALSATGEEQARALGARRRDERLTVVFCSDLLRSFRTAEIAFRDRTIPIVRDARLRECDYGDLTRQPMSEIGQRRRLHVVDPFPNVIGHRATYYAFEHLLNGVPLHEAVTSPWEWQPGWTYHLRSARGCGQGTKDRRTGH